MLRLFSQAGLILMFRLAGAAVIFFLQAAIARTWGKTELAHYLLAFSVINLCAAFMPVGFQTISSYFVAEYGANNKGQSIRLFLKHAYAQILAVFLCMALLSLLLFSQINVQLSWSAHWPQIVMIALATASIFISGSVLVALKQPILGNIADTFAKPFLIAASFLIAWKVSDHRSGIALLLSIAAGAMFLLAIGHGALALQSVFKVPTSNPHQPSERKRWWFFALPWTIIALGTDYFFDIDLVFLSFIMAHDQIAVFGVISRVFMLAAFGVSAAYTIQLPEIFAVEAKTDERTFLKLIGTANLNAMLLAIALCLVIAIAGPFLLRIFGPDFVSGSIALTLVCAALMIRAAFGPAALVLSIFDHPYAALPAVALGIATLFFGNLTLVPAYGLNGAAMAAVLSITVWSAVLWFTCKKLTNLDVSIWPKLRGH